MSFKQTKPFNYQRECFNEIEAFGGRALLAMQMGTGKSLVSLLWAKRNPEIRPIIIVCPASLKWNWHREVIKHFGMSAEILEGRKPNGNILVSYHKIFIINYDILKSWMETLKNLKPKLIIVDECFPHFVPVLTDQGWIPIGDIVNNQLDVKVASFSFSSNAIVFRSIKHYIKKVRDTRLIKINHSNGSLVCTENHEIWVEGIGYVEARRLTKHQKLRVVPKGIQLQFLPTTKKEILQSIMFGKMEDVQKRVQGDGASKKSPKTKRVPEEILGLRKEYGEEKNFLREYDIRQPFFQYGDSKQTNRNEEEERYSVLEWGEGWEWKASSERTCNSVQYSKSGIRFMDTRSSYQNSYGEAFWISNLLQSGYWKDGSETGYRSRWEESQQQGEENTRYQEAELPNFSRVESVKIYEQGSEYKIGGGVENDPFVYCLEVEGDHNFFADGVLVSNCHYIKEEKSLRTKMVKILCEGVPHLLFLSGTPMVNRPRELWPVIKLLKPKLYRSFRQFADLHCKPRMTPWGWNFDGAANLDLLHKTLMKNLMVRRLKEDVLLDLPPKQRFIVPLEIEDRDQYNKAVNDFIVWLSSIDVSRGKRAAKAVELVKKNEIKRLVARLKLKSVMGWVDNFLEGSDQKLLLFAIHKSIVKELQSRYAKHCIVIDGDIPPKQRLAQVDAFQSQKKNRILIGNIQAAGVGLNATAASKVAFAELGWTPGEMNQCEDRSHRHGQTESVQSYYLVARDTMEEKLCELLDTKQKYSDETLDGIEDGQGLDIQSQITDYLIRG